MGREVRRVPADWRHPKDTAGRYVPMSADEMPVWPAEQRTHFHLYETTTKGTPKSPPLPTARSLAQWCAVNGVTAGPGFTGTEKEWLSMIEGSGRCASIARDPSGKSFVSPLAKPK